MPEEWVVNKTSMSNVCRVQRTTEAPIGAKHLGPFKSAAEAAEAMCANLDPTTTDPSKCWLTVPDEACK